MSFVDKNEEICFIHIAKNAGKSISSALKKHFEPSEASAGRHPWGLGSGHCTYYQALRDFPETSKKWYAFAAVREPVDRLVSAYYYLNGIPSPGCGETLKFDKFVEAIYRLSWGGGNDRWSPDLWWKDYARRSLSGQKSRWALPHIVPQNFYFNDNHNINLFKLDKLDEMSLVFKEKFDCDLHIPHLGASVNRKNIEISTHQLKIIEKIYEKDFEIYGRLSSK